MKEYLSLFFTAVVPLFLAVTFFSCDGGDGPGAGPGNGTGGKVPSIVLSPRSGQTVAHDTITFEVNATGIAGVTAQNTTLPDSLHINGVKNGAVFFIYSIPLAFGTNEIKISAKKGDGSTSSEDVTLISASTGSAIGIKIAQEEAYEKVTTEIEVNTLDDCQEFLFDADTDGVIDQRISEGKFIVTYDEPGVYEPVVTVRTADNLLYTSLALYSDTIAIKSQPVVTGIADVPEQIFDLERFDGFVYALSQTKIYKISETDQTDISIIYLVNMNGPQGFCLDHDGNLFIADTGYNRIVKLLKSSDYQPDTSISADGSFGQQGSGNGELQTPRDVAVSGAGTAQEIYVLDAGNNRVQIFNHLGVYTGQFDGSTTPNGKLNNPLNMLGAPDVLITDRGNGLIRELGPLVDGSEHETFAIKDIHDFGKIAYAAKGIVVPDWQNKQILILFRDASIIKKIPVAKNPLIASAFENNNKLITAPQSAPGIELVSIELDPPGHTPIDIAKKFVSAFLEGNQSEMLKLTANENKYIELLLSNETKAREVFNNITEYTQTINQNAAGVSAHFTIGDLQAYIKFDLVRINNLWIIAHII